MRIVKPEAIHSIIVILGRYEVADPSIFFYFVKRGDSRGKIQE